MREPCPHHVHSPNDKFFKEPFSRPEAALDLFQAVLSPRMLQHVEWPALALRPGSFVDEHLSETSADLLYRVPWRGLPLSLYLFQAEASAPSTFGQLAAKVQSTRVKEDVMTIEEQIRQEGWQKGRQEGRQEGWQK